MITWYRVWAQVKQTHRIHFQSLDALVEFVYWPVLNIILWGLNAAAQQSTMHPQYVVSLLLCLVLFRCFVQAFFDISLKFLHELWAKNAINLFVSPLSVSEWIVSATITGAYSAMINLGVGTLTAWLLLGINLWHYYHLLMAGLVVAVMSGGALGMATMSLILLWGARAEKMVWLLAFAFSPFMGIYYPTSTLPPWAQLVGSIVPVTHTFTIIWHYIETGVFQGGYYIGSVAWGIVVWYGAWKLVHMAYRRALDQGLTKLEDI